MKKCVVLEIESRIKANSVKNKIFRVFFIKQIPLCKFWKTLSIIQLFHTIRKLSIQNNQKLLKKLKKTYIIIYVMHQ